MWRTIPAPTTRTPNPSATTSPAWSTTPTRNTVTIILKKFFVRADCDGIEGEGEFDFRAIVNGGGTRAGDFIREADLSDGGRLPFNEEVVFDIDRQVGKQFAVTFYSTEWDRDALLRGARANGWPP